jgi:hypothetical protein
MPKLVIALSLAGLLAVAAAAAAADWRPMPYPLDNPIYECERVPNPMWPLDDDPEMDSSSWVYWAGYTERPKEKKDYHLVAYNGTLWTVQMMHNGQKSELCRGDSLRSVLPCLKAHCRPQRRWR